MHILLAAALVLAAARLGRAALRLRAALAARLGRTPVTAALLLGGCESRERAAGEVWFGPGPKGVPLAGTSGALPLYVSSPASRAAQAAAACRPGARVLLDERAVDTVTNCTSLGGLLKARGHGAVAVLTSAEHARRANVVAWAVLGAGHGVAPWLVVVGGGGGEGAPESAARAARDAVRCALWLLSGVSLAAPLGRWLHPERFRPSPAVAGEDTGVGGGPEEGAKVGREDGLGGKGGREGARGQRARREGPCRAK